MRIFLLICSLFLLISCENDLEKVNLIASHKDPAVEYGYNIEMLYTMRGNLKAKLIAPAVNSFRSQNPYIEFTDGLKVYFYNEEKEVESQLTANYGIYNQTEETIVVRNDVVVINTKGDKLNTEELIWKQNEHRIYSDKFVKITRPDEIIYGDGFESNEEFTEYSIKNIKGTISVETEDM